MSRPSDSSVANSLRTVEGETPRPPRSTSPFEPTGWPLVTYCSTTRRRIRRWRSVRRRREAHLQGKRSLARGRSGEQLGRDAAAEEAAARGQRERSAVDRSVDRASPRRSSRASAASSSADSRPVERSGSSRRRPRRTRSALPRLGVDALELPRRRCSALERRDVARRGRAGFACARRRSSTRRRRRRRGSRGRASSARLCVPGSRRRRAPGGRSSPSRTSGSRRRSAARRRARSSPPSRRPGARALRRTYA